MNIRKYKSTDYDLIASWYKERGTPAIPSDYIPEIGFIVEEKAAMFLCTTNTKFCSIEFLISSPNTTKEERKQYSELLVTELTKVAKDLNYKQIINFVTRPSVIESFKRTGFREFDSGRKIICLIREL